MTGVEIVVAATLAGAAAIAAVAWRHEKEATGERNRLWGLAARQLGPTFGTSFRWPGMHRIGGQSDGFEVVIEGSLGKSARTRWRVLGVPHNLHLTRESLGTSFGKMIAGEDVQVGHAPFDRLVSVRGNETVLLALLDDATREMVMDAVVRNVARVVAGEIVLDESGFVSDPARLVEKARLLLSLAGRLTLGAGARDLVEQLRFNAARDPRAGVRLRNLEVLVQNYAGDPAARAALEAAASGDAAHANRLFAAKALGPAGLPALRKLAEAKGAPRDLRLEAFERTLPHMTGSSALPMLEALLHDADDVLAGRAALALAQRGHREAEDAILQRFRRAVPRGRTELAVALAAIAGPASEPVLLEALEDPLPAGDARAAVAQALGEASPADEARAAIAQALGACGSILSVAPLARLRDDPKQPRRIRSAAAAAVGRIQQRLTGAEAGQLSISDADGEAGRLAVAGGEAGSLTIPKDRPS